ncbi:MAG: hypothetical protein ACYDAY_06030 [Candidatus Dormibacteria bacterium]
MSAPLRFPMALLPALAVTLGAGPLGGTPPVAAAGAAVMTADAGRVGFGSASDPSHQYSMHYVDPSGTREQAGSAGASLTSLHVAFAVYPVSIGVAGAKPACQTVVAPDDSAYADPTYGDYFDFSCGDNQGWQNYRASLVETGAPGSQSVSVDLGDFPCSVSVTGKEASATFSMYGFDGSAYNLLASSDGQSGSMGAVMESINAVAETCQTVL